MSRPLLPQVPPYLNAVPNPANVVQLTAAPTSAYVDQPLGTIGLYNGAAYLLAAKTSSTATWLLLESSGGAGVFTTLSSTGTTNLNTTGTAATNIGVSGSTTTMLGTVNINASGAGVTTIGTGGTGATNIGNAMGNTTITGTLTSTAGITASTGNIVATAGAVSAGTTVTAGTGLIATLGGVQVSAASVSGATPVVNDVRTGQVSFTDAIANGAYGTLVNTNSVISGSSVIIATVSCATANSAPQIVGITPGSGTVSYRVYNAGSASTSGNNIIINFWVLN